MGARVGIVGCSNGLNEKGRTELEKLADVLRKMELEPVCVPSLLAVRDVHSAWPEERAAMLMQLYRDDDIREIYDVSGGDLANEVLPFLDYEEIARSGKRLWGYSDLTCVLNAIYARTGMESVLYQVRSMVWEKGEDQQARFRDAVNGGDELYRFEHTFLQGERMEGVVVGGNIRCLLKLAGTECWPDMKGKILLLEGLGTTVAQVSAFFAQLYQLGAFRDAAGILLGTFTKMDQNGEAEAMIDLLKRWIGPEKPLARTMQIGHGADSRAIVIGRRLVLGA